MGEAFAPSRRCLSAPAETSHFFLLFVQDRLNELGQAMDRVTVLGQQVEKLCADLRDQDGLLKHKDTQLQTLQAAADQRKRSFDEEAERCQREKAKRARLEDELKACLILKLHLHAESSLQFSEIRTNAL